MTQADRVAFIAKVAPAAQASERASCIPASVTIAQAILESSDRNGNWGQSREAVECCNYFGIKARQGEDYAEFKTGEVLNGKPVVVTARFRKFPSIPDSFVGHAQLIARLPRYAKAMEAARDPHWSTTQARAQAFAQFLQEGGYSTNPNYAAELLKLVKKYGLTQYDTKEAA
jgi:flagellum-specific peptidoglycan hydrolase FlgJ